MHLYYELSKNQIAAAKDGKALRIAIPQTPDCPYSDNDELTAWVLDKLPDLGVADIKQIHTGHVWCHLLNRGGGEGSLSNTIGEVVDRDNVDKFPCLSARVVVVHVGDGKAVTRWPGGKVVWARPDK